MIPLVDLAIRSSAVLLAGFAAAALLRRRSAAVRHAVLVCALVAGTVVVPLGAVLPSWHVHVPLPAIAGERVPPGPSVASGLSREPATAGPAAVPATRIMSPLVGVWLAGVLVGAARLAVGLLRLARTRARARPVPDRRWLDALRRLSAGSGVSRPIALVETDAADSVATWGILRPVVLVPRHAHGWPEARVHAVLAHELAHIRRHDWFVQMAVEIMQVVHWYNPLVWAACTRLRQESERAADDEVLARGVPARDYAGHLVEIARTCRRSGSRWAPAMTMARPSALEGRIAAMLSPHLERRTVSRRVLVLTAALMLALALPIAVLRAGQEGPRPLTGIVYDVSGGVLPGVQLTLEGADGVTWQTEAGADGRFAFPPVLPGRYGFDIRLIGFRPLRQDVELKSARDWDRAITLQVGELTERVSVQASRIEPQPGTPQTPAPQRVRVGGNIKVPTKTHHVNPDYPQSMREAGREGQVAIDAIIDTQGHVQAARVLGAHVHPDFAAAALDAVRQWQFTPTLLNGSPVEVRMTVTVDFRLAD